MPDLKLPERGQRPSRPPTRLLAHLAVLAAASAALLLSGCSADDESRPGFPRTPRTPIAESPYPYAESAEDVGLSADAVWLFKERLYSRVVARHVIGSEILIIKEGQIVLHQAMGWADRDDLLPLERNAIYPIASLTKPFLGTAVLSLAEDGQIDLDTPVASYLESFDNDRSHHITVRQLLTHRSGFVQGGHPPGYSRQPSLVAAVDLVGERGPDFAPGDRFVYSNLNSEILGAIVEAVTRDPVERAIERLVVQPLGLADTHASFDPTTPWAARVVSLYRRWGYGPWERWWSPARPAERPWFSPAGDLYSSARDVARFLEAWMHGGSSGGGRLLGEETVEAGVADPVADDRLASRSRWYGMHWEIYRGPDSEGGRPVFGHRGATGTLGMALPEQDAIVVYLTNSSETEVVEEVIGMALELLSD